jgi:hypothetical protein
LTHKIIIRVLIIARNQSNTGQLQAAVQKNVELAAALQETQLRTGAMSAAAEELYGKLITVCR